MYYCDVVDGSGDVVATFSGRTVQIARAVAQDWVKSAVPRKWVYAFGPAPNGKIYLVPDNSRSIEIDPGEFRFPVYSQNANGERHLMDF